MRPSRHRSLVARQRGAQPHQKQTETARQRHRQRCARRSRQRYQRCCCQPVQSPHRERPDRHAQYCRRAR